MNELFIRSESHEIDTQARKIVPLAFPPQWEFREMNGRDYGIDMIIEVFNKGNPSGNFLALQIKGTAKTIEDNISNIIFDFPVKTLRYAELFSSPVLLTICPINDKKMRVFFLWLQEYIDIVLDFENPNWRKNKSSVRLFIPKKNLIQDNIDRIDWISNHPRRLKEYIDYAIICSNIDRLIDYILECYQSIIDGEITKQESEINNLLVQLINYIDQIKGLNSIFGYKEWKSPQSIFNDNIKPPYELAKKLIKNGEIDFDKLRKAVMKLEGISNLLYLLNDRKLARSVWKEYGCHDF